MTTENLPYVFKKGRRVEVPKGLGKGEVFRQGKHFYVVIDFVDRLDNHWRYGQPINVRRKRAD